MFERIGGRVANTLFFLNRCVNMAPMRVARLPRIISHKTQPVKIFASKHPINRPGMAYGVKMGNIVNASDSLICIAPLARPNAFARKVSTTYAAAMIEAIAIPRIFFLVFNLISSIVFICVRMVSNSHFI